MLVCHDNLVLNQYYSNYLGIYVNEKYVLTTYLLIILFLFGHHTGNIWTVHLVKNEIIEIACQEQSIPKHKLWYILFIEI